MAPPSCECLGLILNKQDSFQLVFTADRSGGISQTNFYKVGEKRVAGKVLLSAG